MESAKPRVDFKTATEYLYYDQLNGLLFWKKSPAHHITKGDLAGSMASNGYWCVVFRYRYYLAHHLIWLLMHGEYPVGQIDHINQNRSDNRFCNLREVTGSENQQNRPRQKNNSSGITGVTWCSHWNRWVSRIGYKNNLLHLGRYTDFFEACCARKSAECSLGFHPNHGRSPELQKQIESEKELENV